MAIDIDLLRALTKSASQPMTPGNQAMANAAQMAAPPGAPPLPSAPSPAQSSEQPNAEATVPEAQYKKEMDGKTKEIESLRAQLQDAKFEVQRTKMRSEFQQQQQKMQLDMQAKQQAMLDKVKGEQAALDKRQAEVEQQNAQQKIQLERDAAQQQMNIAREEAKSIQNIAKRDADSIKATAADNAKSYVRMTDDARKAADGYMASKQQELNKQQEAARNSTPYIPPALQSQLRGAMAAAKNVGKFRARLAKTNASIHKEASQQPQQPQQPQPQPAQQQPPQNLPAQQNTTVRVPAGVTKVPGNWQLQTEGNAYGVNRRTYSVPAQGGAPGAQGAPAQPAAPATSGPQISAEQQRQNARMKQQDTMAQNRRLRQQRANTLLSNVSDKVVLQGTMLDRHKGMLTAKANMNRLAAKGAQNTEEYKQWAQAYNYANKELATYRQSVEQKAAAGDAAAKEELAQMKDFTQKRETSGGAGLLKKVNPLGWISSGARALGFGGAADKLDEVATFGLSNRRSEEEEFLEAAQHGMTPEEFAAKKQEESRGGAVKSFLKGFFVDPFVNAGNSFNENERASQLAKNRGVSRNWWSDDYSSQGEAGKNYLNAIQQRGLKHSALGNYGSIALNNGLMAADVIGTAAMVIPGIGTAAGAGLKGLSALGRGAKMFSAASKLGVGGRMAAAARGLKAGWKPLKALQAGGGAMGRAAGAVRKFNTTSRMGLRAFRKANPKLYRAAMFAPFAPIAGEAAAIGGQMAGTDKLNFLSQDSWGGHDMRSRIAQDDPRQVMEGYYMGAAGNLYDPETGGQTTRDWIRGSHYGSDEGAMARSGRLRAYKQMNPGWYDSMGKSASVARNGQDSWNQSLMADNMPLRTDYDRDWRGKLLTFVSPFVNNMTNGIVNLVPNYEMPKIKVSYSDPAAAIAATSDQTYNPEFNRGRAHRMSPLARSLEHARMQSLGYGPLLGM